jgi:hypothetical protein
MATTGKAPALQMSGKEGDPIMKRQSSKREGKREMLLSGGNHQQSTKSAFGANVKRSSAADRPARAKTNAADRGRRRREG